MSGWLRLTRGRTESFWDIQKKAQILTALSTVGAKCCHQCILERSPMFVAKTPTRRHWELFEVYKARAVKQMEPEEFLRYWAVNYEELAIHSLQVLGYAEVGAWSRPQPTQNPAEFVSIMTRNLRLE